MPSHLTSRRASSNRMPMTSWHLPVGRRSKGELARREKPFATTASATTTHLSELRLSNLRDTSRRSVHLPLTTEPVRFSVRRSWRPAGCGLPRCICCESSGTAPQLPSVLTRNAAYRRWRRLFTSSRRHTSHTSSRCSAAVAPARRRARGPNSRTRGRRRPLRPSISPLLHARTSATSLNARRWLRSYPC